MAKTKGDAVRCLALTLKGERCKNNAREGHTYCVKHVDYDAEHAQHDEDEHDNSMSESEVESHSHNTSQHQPSHGPVLFIPPAPVRVQVPVVSRSTSQLSLPSPNVISPYLASPMTTPVSGLRSGGPQRSPPRPTVSNTPSQSVTSGMTAATNATNSSVYSTVEHRIEALENAIRNLTLSMERNGGTTASKSRKSRQSKPWTNEKAVEKAKFLFYHDHKKDEEIINAVRGGLEQGHMLVFRTKKVGDTVMHTPNIHWQLVKDATDLKFEALADTDKDAYIRKAWEEYHQKRVTL